MIIVDQNKDEIVNFDNIINIMITNCDGEFVISAVALVGVDDIYRELGYYKTEERAKEVLQKIICKYKATEELKICINRITDGVGAIGLKECFVYEMPEK